MEHKRLPDNIRAVVFDVDGTLVDSLDAWAESDRIFLAENNVPYDAQISEKLKTMHFISAAQYFIDELHVDMTLDEVMDRINEIIGRKYREEITAKPGAFEFAKQCTEKGIHICAATSNLRGLAEGVLESNGFMPLLDFILTSDEIGSGKDDPGIFLECAARMGAAPCDTAVFEDSFHAALTASKAGFFTVGVYDRKYADEFERLGDVCDMTVNDMSELLTVKKG